MHMLREANAGSNALVPVTHVVKLSGTPGYWLQNGSIPIFADTCGVNQQTGDSLSLTHTYTLPLKLKQTFLKPYLFERQNIIVRGRGGEIDFPNS